MEPFIDCDRALPETGIDICPYPSPPTNALDLVDDSCFERRVTGGHPGPTLVLFTAERCPPCKMLDPLMVDLAREVGNAVTLLRCPVETAPATAARLGVSSTPALMLFAGGEIAAVLTGMQPFPAIREWLAARVPGVAATPPIARPPDDRVARRRAFLRAFFRRSTALRAGKVAAVVAPVLLAVNHGDLLLRDPFSAVVLRHLGLNLLVPFLVSSYSTARTAVEQSDRNPSPIRGDCSE